MKNERIPMAGIYQILNVRSGEKYVGSSSCLYERLRAHLGFLANGTHINRRLQEAWKDGATDFRFSILEVVPDPLLLPQREIVWIQKTGAQELGFNTKTDLYKRRTLLQVGGELKREMESLKLGSMNATVEKLIRFYYEYSKTNSLKEVHKKFHGK